MVIRQLINHLHWPLTLFTMLVFFALIKLGVWQSERAQEKQHRIDKINVIAKQQVLPLATALQQAKTLDINDLKVSVTAEFEPTKLILLDNQVNQGKVGYRVLQPVIHSQGLSLVNLGWVSGTSDRQLLPKVEAISGVHQFQGYLRAVDVGVMLQPQQFEQVKWPLVIQQIELEKLSQVLGQALGDYVIYLDPDSELGFVKNWQPIVMPPEKHKAYAFQWFSLAIAWLILMLWAFTKSYNNNNEKVQ